MTSAVVFLNTSGPLVHHPFAVARSAEIEDGPAAVRLLGRNLVLWRSPSGAAVAAPDVCTHSRGVLSEGRVVDGGLVCPNHGWTFGDAGRCIAKPTNLPIPDKAHLTTFFCVEQYGLIWVALGDPATGVIDVTWDSDDRYRRVQTEASVWRSNPIQILEVLLGSSDSDLVDDVTADVPFVVRRTLKSEGSIQHHLLSCAPIDVRNSLVTSVIWTSTDGHGADTQCASVAAASLGNLKSVVEEKGLQLPSVEIHPADEGTILNDWKRRLLASLSS